MTSDRAELIERFLQQAGWGSARISPLAGDASNRRYLRLAGPQGAAVLMDAPPETGEDTRPFERMTHWLREQGLSAPAVLASDADAGFLLLEDLGDDLYSAHIQQQPQDETALYSAAVRLLVDLADRDVPGWLPTYDAAVLDREARLFVEWWLPAACDADTSSDDADAFSKLTEGATRAVQHSRETVVLRDYHAENLIWLPERNGHAKVGLLDYQDALAGHPAYDLVSLLEDARRDTSDTLQEAMIEHYLAERPDLRRDEFLHAYAALGAQRNLKIIGIFARLALRDGKPRYLSMIPRVWGHLMRDLRHPELSALRDWVLEKSPEPSQDVLSRIAAQVVA